MKKINSVFFKSELKKKLYQAINFPVLCCGIILIALFQIQVLQAAASPNETTLDSAGLQTSDVEQDMREIKPGETVERQTSAKEIHGYQITLEAGTSVEITFGKRNISVQLAALIPDNKDYSVPGKKIPAGKELSRVIAGSGEVLVEPMVIVADKTDNYIITTRFLTSGTYSINCSLPRPVSETDRKYAAAGKLFAEIRQAIESGKPLWEMRDKLEERAAIYRSLDDKKSLALSLNDVGRTFETNAEFGKAVKYYKEALELFRALKSTPDIVSNLRLIGSSSSQMRDYQTAIDSHNERLALSRGTADKAEEAGALHMLGVAYHLLADEQKARDFYEQSISVQKSINPPNINSLGGEGVSLTNIGNLYRGVSYGEIAIDFFSPRTTDDRQKAIRYYRQAIEIWQQVTKLNSKANTLEAFNIQQIGNTYKELGDYTEALKYLNQSLEYAKARNSKPGQTNVLISIGNLYVLKGDYQKSFEFFEQALTLLRAGAYNVNQVEYLNNMARDYYRAGETQKALDIYNEALTLSRARGQYEVAAASLFETARIERDLGNFANARNRIEESLQIVESMRANIASQDVRATYFATVKRYYDFYIDLQMQARKSQPEKGFDALALETSEKSRSRSLLDLLSLARIDIKQGVDSALLEREQKARQRITDKAYQQSRLLLAKHTKEEAEKINQEVTALTDEYQAIQTEIRNKSPRYAALTQPMPLNAKQIQQLLDSGTILLEYSLGEKKSYLWAVSSDSIASFDLPGREEIEAWARRVYELLTARNQNPVGETDEQRRIRVKAAENQYPETAAGLSQMLLGPAVSLIGNKRLVIVADGALNYIPFSALPAPQKEESSAALPLGANHEIVNLPSASTLARLRDEISDRKIAPKMLAVFADPVFNQNDVRSTASKIAGQTKVNARRRGETSQSNDKTNNKTNDKTKNPSVSRDFERAVSDVGLAASEASAIPRLPFSRREADAIFKVAPKNLSLKQVDFKANKTEIFNSDLEQYRMLHFATHSLLNSQHPELSGVVLSLVDENGRDVDGFLRLQDIYNLKLSADLVVLSACNTALGKDIKGEGVVGLTRGFMYAGAPRVVASLWKVDDAATAELMTIFYRKMLAENLRPAAALRAAQMEMMRQTRWKSPYYWSPFIIQGEWK